MPVKREREETPEGVPESVPSSARQDSVSPLKKSKSDEYRLDFGVFSGLTLDEIPDWYFGEIAEDNDLVANNESLRRALFDWSALYRIGFGMYEGKHLEDVPIAWINTWVYATEKRDDCRLRVALKWHFKHREPEAPGSRYMWSFGQYCGIAFENTPEQNDWMLPYDEWHMLRGVGCDPCWEEVTEVLLFSTQQKLNQLLERNPDVLYYRLPASDRQFPGRRVADLPLFDIFDLDQQLSQFRRDDSDVKLTNAVRYRMLKHWLVRWNWRGDFERRNGEDVFVPKQLGDLTYPSTQIPVEEDYEPRPRPWPWP